VPSDENENNDSQKTLVYVVVACCGVVFVAACGLLVWKFKPCGSSSALPSPDLSQSFIPLSEKLGAQLAEVALNAGDIELPTMQSVVTIVTEDEDPIL
jgi:threonine/homoserine efflux transporter RhtA